MALQAEYTAWSGPQAFYVHGAGTDEPLVRQTGANTTRQFYHQDGCNVAASSGTIAQYGYTGRESDQTGLVFYRARY